MARSGERDAESVASLGSIPGLRRRRSRSGTFGFSELRTDQRHKWIVEKISDAVEISPEKVEDVLFSIKERISALNRFFSQTGPRSMFCLKTAVQTPKSMFGGIIDEDSSVKDGKLPHPAASTPERARDGVGDSSLFDFSIIFDLEANPVTGPCIYFVKLQETDITESNIEKSIVFGHIQDSPLNHLEVLLRQIFLPAWDTYESCIWGKLCQQDNSTKLVDDFRENNSSFAQFIAETKAGIVEFQRLEKPSMFDMVEDSPPGISRSAFNPEIVTSFEETVESWINYVNRVFDATTVENHQVLESNEGPAVELSYWKTRMTKFNALVDQLDEPWNILTLSVLESARSPMLKEWKATETKLKDAASEAEDNTKYLFAIDHLNKTLYRSNPKLIVESLVPLMTSVNLVLGISRYYNTQERLTSLFVRISNQMITSCKLYLQEEGPLLDQEPGPLLERLRTCIDLNEQYRMHFLKTKEETMASDNLFTKKFDFSEALVFGKFDILCVRLQMLVDLMTTIGQFKSLGSTNFDGMDRLLATFNAILNSFRKDTSDPLDITNPQFEKRYVAFNKDILELENRILQFINICFDQQITTKFALYLLQQFHPVLQRENLKNEYDKKYNQIFTKYAADLKATRETYEKYKNDPPRARDLPRVAGNIQWARQLLRRIEEPMMQFQENKDILKTRNAKLIIKSYNKLASALVEFETLWHHGWLRTLTVAKDGLMATIFVRSEDEETRLVNYDPAIDEVVREARALERMGLEIPEAALSLCAQNKSLKSYHAKFQLAVREYMSARSLLRAVYVRLIEPLTDQIEEVFGEGEKKITWGSVAVSEYYHRLDKILQMYRSVITKANDVLSLRIHNKLEEIRDFKLFHFPKTPMNIDSLDAAMRDEVEQSTLTMDKLCHGLENGVYELVALFTQSFDSHDTMASLEEDINDFMQFYSRLNYEAVYQCLERNLQAIHDCIMDAHNKPILSVEIELSVPEVVLSPSLDEIQHFINVFSRYVLDVSRSVFLWGQDRTQEAEELQTYFEEISGVKKLVQLLIITSGAVHKLNDHIKDHLKKYYKHDFLWRTDKNEAYQEFLGTNPTLFDFERQIKRFQAIEADVMSMPPSSAVYMLSLESNPFKYAVKAEAVQWKSKYGEKIKERNEAILAELNETIDDLTYKVGKEYRDLEDVRFVMGELLRLREMQWDLDLKFQSVEEGNDLLLRHEIHVAVEALELLEDTQIKWKKLTDLAFSTRGDLQKVQSTFRVELLDTVKEFKEDVDDFTLEYDKKGPNVVGIKPNVAIDRLRRFQKDYADKERKWNSYAAGEKLFGLAETEYPSLSRIGKELALLARLYDLYGEVNTSLLAWRDTLWVGIDTETMGSLMQSYQLRCRKLPKGLRGWEAYNELRKTVDDFVDTLPLLQMMEGKALRPRHWDQLTEVTGATFSRDTDTFKLGDVLEAPLLNFREDVEDICESAVKEADVESKVNRISEEWSAAAFAFSDFKGRGNLILESKRTSEIIESLEDSLMSLGSLQTSRYSLPFKDKIMSWIHRLSTASEIIDSWLQVQALWVYLEAVFCGGDIGKQLPQEAKRFNNVDKQWGTIMSNATDRPHVVNFTVNEDILQSLLPYLTEQLELCQKSLTGYLEAKRVLFPRFYFVSDPVLLEILGHASEPSSIRPHMRSISDNIGDVEFSKSQKESIVAMISSEGQRVPLSSPVECKGNIETWLSVFLDEMRDTLQQIVADAAYDVVETPLDEFIADYPAQVTLLGIQMLWTLDAEDSLARSKTEKNAMKHNNSKVNRLLHELVELTVGDLSTLERTKVEAMITIQVHQRDIFEQIVKLRVKSPKDFEWLKQTRFYWVPDADDCRISVTDIDFWYQYEYLGCTDRLVVTPLTDRCYITLAQAVGMHLGGAPAGPAGTGKTETVKDMGKALGKYVVVFNCSDQMDFRGLGKIYKGLAQSGSWGCFDEFNRIELEVLSVVAQQIFCVLSALRDRKRTFVFTDGQELKVDTEVGFFITMNPGYAGRQELPENLKALFRSVAMMVPDRQIIMRVKLAAVGFHENAKLARKFFVLYELCEGQLSKQRHYDFGLRNILSVLRSCGAAKRSNPTNTETEIIMRVIRDMNLSKLVDEDEPLFLSLINDVFPGEKVSKQDYPKLSKAIADKAEAAGLVNHPDWNLKLIQLYETSLVRHGVMVLGGSGAGKTCCIRTLLQAMTQCGTTHKEVRMNPKAISAPQMFGRLDVATNDWTDGIFSSLWRKACKRKGEHIWITLDGPVDAIWIENLNTVLDDNKTLTLANSDRIPMTPTLRLIFEVGNLDNASPATVSRAGIIFMSPAALGWKPLVAGWMKKRPRESALGQILDSTIGPALDFIRDSCKPVMEVGAAQLVATCLDLLAALLDDKQNNSGDGGMSAKKLGRILVFAMCWSLGALLDGKDRLKLHLHFKTVLKLDLPSPSSSDESVFEYFVSKEGEWEHWSTQVPDYVYPVDSTPAFASIMVPTVDNVRINTLVGLCASQNRAVLLTGESGSAKTVTLKGYLRGLDESTNSFKTISFSSATTPRIFQRVIEGSVEKQHANVYGPPGHKAMTVFIDDISMPEINEWGDQVTNEIVRQLIEEKGFYNLEKPGEWTSIVELRFLGAMNHPGGGRNDIPSRLKRHFAVFNCTLPSIASINTIYGTIISGHFCPEREFAPQVVTLAKSLTKVTRLLWERTKEKMLPTPSKFHYIFNLRDLSRVTEGILRCTSEGVTDANGLLKLWSHECRRVMSDKLNTSSDVSWFARTMVEIVNENFDFEDGEVESLFQNSWYVDFLREPTEDDIDQGIVPQVLEEVSELTPVKERVQQLMKEYNDTVRGGKLDLVLFDDAVKHLMRITRVLRMARGNVLLVGVGGSGKQSLTRLASFIAGNKTVQITVTKSYNTTNLLDDIKFICTTAGAQDVPVTFIFTDNEIRSEGFLEYINMLLTSGEVPNLFAKEEVETILGTIREQRRKAKDESFEEMPNDGVWAHFLEKVRDNLHIALCFSPVGDKFRQRSRKFPGLISDCTIDWFFKWPNQALLDVAKQLMGNFTVHASVKMKSLPKRLAEHMAFVHSSVSETTGEYMEKLRRHVYVTPKSYLSFIRTYQSLYTEKKRQQEVQCDNLKAGLDKLRVAASDVEAMKVELKDQEEKLQVAQHECSVQLTKIMKQTAEAEAVKADVQVVKDALADDKAVIDAQKQEAEADLLAAKPALDDAEAALNQIRSADIATLKKLGKPPNLIKRIMDGVMVLRRYPLNRVEIDQTQLPQKKVLNASWDVSFKMMGEADFLQRLQLYPKDEMINEETCELLDVYLEMEDFTYETARKSCGNVAGLCNWIRGMRTYYEVAKHVAPKIAALKKAEGELERATRKLDAAQKELDAKQKILDEIQAVYDGALGRKQKLEDDANQTKARMKAANALIDGLSGERKRWSDQIMSFQTTLVELSGNIAIASAFLSYAGPFNQAYRNFFVSESWTNDLKERAIPFDKTMSLTSLLGSDDTFAQWNIQGLPTDELSLENGIIVTNATRYPLLIDPQAQGSNWIRNMEEMNSLTVTTLKDKKFRDKLELCVQDGLPMLIEDVGEELDPILDPILDKMIFKQGKRWKVKVGDEDVDWNEDFRLYLTTKLPNPHFTPEVYAKSMIIDFTVTSKGLEDQLLGVVISREKAELEIQLKTLKETIAANMATAKQLEEDILMRLSSSKGNLLDDTELVEVLRQTKLTTEEISRTLEDAKRTEKQINVSREEFRPVATRGSILYFLIAEMSLVDHMYSTSLAQFLKLFNSAMDNSEKSMMASIRIPSIINFATESITRFVTRGVFESHKFMFVLLLALKIDLEAKNIQPGHFGVLLKAGGALDIKAVEKKSQDWIPDRAWLNLCALQSFGEGFSGVLRSVDFSRDDWKRWYELEDPETVDLPHLEGKPLDDPFTKLLVIRCIREDRTMLAASSYIEHALGVHYVSLPPLDLEATYLESDCTTPLVCLLSQGTDPSALIESLAKKSKVELKAVSMGQGQEVIAEKLVLAGIAEGGWVLLQNCHLGIKFLEELESILAKPPTEIHQNFRLWITAEPTPRFPIGLLQESIKITNQPPEGVRAGLIRSLNGMNQDIIDSVDTDDWRRLLFTLCYLHTAVQERRKYGPLGWNIPYEFNNTDLGVCVRFAQNFMVNRDEKKPIEWKILRYMIGEVQYGGRITDNLDRRLMNTFCNVWLDNAIFVDAFCFHTGYTIPVLEKITEYRAHAQSLPLVDNPQCFGLHGNSDISFRTKATESLFNTVIDIQPKDAGGTGMNREDTVKALCLSILHDKLPSDFQPKAKILALVKEKMGGHTPMNIFLMQEIDRMQKVIAKTRSDTSNLLLAIEGTIVMSDHLLDCLNCLFDARVPQSWSAISWQSKTIGVWLSDVIDRTAQLRSWLATGRPKVYWLTGFFNPQAFLTAMRQEITRVNTGWSLDAVILRTEVTRHNKEDIRTHASGGGVYIYGLTLEGCSWNRKTGRLADLPPKQLFSPLPVVHVSAIMGVRTLDAHLYQCPVYKTPNRTDLNYIFDVELFTDEPTDKWVLRGVALLCQIE